MLEARLQSASHKREKVGMISLLAHAQPPCTKLGSEKKLGKNLTLL